DRILLGSGRQLVDEALGDKDIVRWTDAAPERGRNARWLHAYIFDVEVRQSVGQIDRAFRRVRIETIPEAGRQPTRDHRRPGEAVFPRNNLAILVETCRKAIEPIWPVHVVLDVF